MSRFISLQTVNRYVNLLTMGFSEQAYNLYGKKGSAKDFHNNLNYDWSIFDDENKANDHRKNLCWAYQSCKEMFDDDWVNHCDILCIVGCPGPLVMGAISPWFDKSGYPIIAMFKPGEGTIIIKHTFQRPMPVVRKDLKQLHLIGNTIPNKYFKPNFGRDN